jgi:hypothetical protein
MARDGFASRCYRGAATVDGYVQDRFMMDFQGDYLRVVSHDWNDGGHIFVSMLQADRAARTLKFAGTPLDLGGIGQLTAARFAEDRVYLVHQVRVDLLDVVDLSNPESPVRLSSLEIPGWLEHIEVRGDRPRQADVGPRPQRDVQIRLLGGLRATRIDDDELRASLARARGPTSAGPRGRHSAAGHHRIPPGDGDPSARGARPRARCAVGTARRAGTR